MDDVFRPTRALRTQAYFDGAWRASSNGAVTPVISPATGAVIGSVPRLTPEDAQTAIVAASKAFISWSGLTAVQRAAVLKRWHALILREREGLAQILREYRKVWGNHAAIPISDEDFSAGCHCSNLVRSVPSSTRARVCSMRCAPRFDQRIC